MDTLLQCNALNPDKKFWSSTHAFCTVYHCTKLLVFTIVISIFNWVGAFINAPFCPNLLFLVGTTAMLKSKKTTNVFLLFCFCMCCVKVHFWMCREGWGQREGWEGGSERLWQVINSTAPFFFLPPVIPFRFPQTFSSVDNTLLPQLGLKSPFQVQLHFTFRGVSGGEGGSLVKRWPVSLLTKLSLS